MDEPAAEWLIGCGPWRRFAQGRGIGLWDMKSAIGSNSQKEITTHEGKCAE